MRNISNFIVQWCLRWNCFCKNQDEDSTETGRVPGLADHLFYDLGKFIQLLLWTLYSVNCGGWIRFLWFFTFQVNFMVLLYVYLT